MSKSKLLEAVNEAAKSKDFASLSPMFTAAPLLSDVQKQHFLKALQSLRVHIENKGRSTVETVLSIALSAFDILLKKTKADKNMLAKVLEAKGQWLSLAAMSLGADDATTKKHIMNLVDSATKSKDEKDFAPYVLCLRLCVDKASDVLALCEKLKEDLVQYVRQAQKSQMLYSYLQ